MNMVHDNAHTICPLPGSARVSRAGFGVSPKRPLTVFEPCNVRSKIKVRDGEDAIASTRDACATQSMTYAKHG
jgi:hypothetical protein